MNPHLPRKASSLLLLMVAALIWPTSAWAVCQIKDSPCYPWRIEADENETVVFEIVPNNTLTSAIYRVCTCAPADGVSVVFEFQDNTVPLGILQRKQGDAICRDYRINTTRTSRLKLHRLDGTKGAVEGCYGS